MFTAPPTGAFNLATALNDNYSTPRFAGLFRRPAESPERDSFWIPKTTPADQHCAPVPRLSESAAGDG